MTTITRHTLTYLFLALLGISLLFVFITYSIVEQCALQETLPFHAIPHHLMLLACLLILLASGGIFLVFRWLMRQIDAREKILEQADRRLALVTEAGGFGIWDWDIVNNVLHWDDRTFEIFGMSRERFDGGRGDWEGVLHPEDRERVVAASDDALKSGDGYETSYRIVRPDGEIRFIRAVGAVIRGAGGRPVRFIGSNTDVTPQQVILEAVIRERNKAQLYLDIAGVMFAAIDRTGVIILINKKGAEILGYEEEELLGRNWFDICLPAGVVDLVKEVFAKQMAGEIEQVEFFENPILTRSGEERTIAFHNTLLHDDGGAISGVLFSGDDVTARKHLEGQLRHSQKLEAVGLLAGGVAHDFNNILTVIGGYGSLLEMRIQAHTPEREMVEQILAAADRAANLTRSLLAFSRKQDLHPAHCSLNEMIQNVAKFLKRVIGEDISFKMELSPLLLTVHADRGQLEQVIINLAANARDAMPDGGQLTLTTGTAVIDDAFVEAQGFGAPGEYALLSVADTGTGMDEETRSKIFQPFFTTKEVGKGTGLGLSIVYGIVQQHNGFIDVESEQGVGTVFRVYLPATLGQVSVPARKETREEAPTGKETILVVEDEEHVRDVVNAALAEFGYRTISAVNGEDALEKFHRHRDSIKLVFTDLIMPGKSGRELFDELKAIDPGIRVLFTSGYTSDLLDGLESLRPQVEILMKPISPPELARKVRGVLDA